MENRDSPGTGVAWSRYALALAAGVVAGWVATMIGLPLPWMLGPMIANTALSLAGAPVACPVVLRPLVIPVIGLMLGSGFQPEVFSRLGEWVVTLLTLPLFILIAGATSFVFYRRIGGYDRVTAYFSAMPGGFNEMIMLGEEAGGDDRKIAMAHAIRILFVVSFVALFFGLFLGVRSGGGTATWIGFVDVSLLQAAALLVCALAGVLLGRALRFPAPNLLGPMVLSSVAYMTEVVTTPPPTLIVVLAQISVGTIIGTRFVGTRFSDVRRDLVLGCGAALLAIFVALGIAECVVLVTGAPISQVFLAFSPGGLTEMSLLAVALDQDIAYVATNHVARIVLVIFAAPLVFRLLRRSFKQKLPR
ncbi:MAG: AbrB family transcriptional regulator [Pseudomonadota bacterium]